jgi:hypothetical protein
MRVILIFQFFVINTLLGQDINEAKEIVSLLTSPEYWGRGYTNNGMSKSADFLASRFKSYGVKPISGKNFFQDFTYSINSFPGKMEVAINGKTLAPGVDFLISGDSKGVVTSGNLVQVDSVHFINQEKKIQVILQDKLTWSPSTQLIDYTIILVDKKMVSEPPQKIST